jgi:hypothetical protein
MVGKPPDVVERRDERHPRHRPDPGAVISRVKTDASHTSLPTQPPGASGRAPGG